MHEAEILIDRLVARGSFDGMQDLVELYPIKVFGDAIVPEFISSIVLILIFFGYIARVARAGRTEALDADYTRTAVMKGLTWRIVLRRPVLRNALLPTITVIASLIGYFGRWLRGDRNAVPLPRNRQRNLRHSLARGGPA